MQSIIFTLYTKLVHTYEEKLVNKPAMGDIKTKAHVCAAETSLEGYDGGRQRANTQRPALGTNPTSSDLRLCLFFVFL